MRSYGNCGNRRDANIIIKRDGAKKRNHIQCAARNAERKKNMKVSDDTKAICRSIDALTKEIKWLAVLVEEIQKKDQEPEKDKDGAGSEE